MDYRLNHLQQLEAESISIFREAVGQLQKPVLLFSGGKDSITLVHLAKKAFWPAKIPFPLLHVDTGHNFQETIDFRDKLIEQNKLELIVASVEDIIQRGMAQDETGPYASRNRIQSVALMDAIEQHHFDCLFGGARRDEDKARAKERIFSHRDEFGEWKPKNQRPELWELYNGHKRTGEHLRVFPLSHWTELDIWEYIRQEKIELPSLYFSHQREVFERNNVLYFKAPFMQMLDGEQSYMASVRFRTIGDITCTGAVKSLATSLDEVINEIMASRTSERGDRADDKRSESSMEDRKKEGYF